MSDNEMMQAVLAELKALRNDMNSMQAQIGNLQTTVNSIDKRVEHLEAGQLAIRRDVSKLDKKVDILCIESGQALDMLGNVVNSELTKLKEAK